MKDTRKLGGAGVFIFFMFFLNSADPTTSEPGTGYLLQPRSHVDFSFFGGGRPTSKAREKRPWDEVVLAMQAMSRQLQIGGEGEGGTRPIFGYR